MNPHRKDESSVRSVLSCPCIRSICTPYPKHDERDLPGWTPQVRGSSVCQVIAFHYVRQIRTLPFCLRFVYTFLKRIGYPIWRVGRIETHSPLTIGWTRDFQIVNATVAKSVANLDPVWALLTKHLTRTQRRSARSPYKRHLIQTQFGLNYSCRGATLKKNGSIDTGMGVRLFKSNKICVVKFAFL